MLEYNYLKEILLLNKLPHAILNIFRPSNKGTKKNKKLYNLMIQTGIKNNRKRLEKMMKDKCVLDAVKKKLMFMMKNKSGQLTNL